MHDIVIVGVPLIAILAGILFNQSETRELGSEIQRLEVKFDKKLDEVRDAGHRDSLEILRAMTSLHERVAIVEDRQNR